MGVTGSGKTTVGALLAGRLGARFVDGDDFHPEANVAKMAQGTPLTDQDRLPWLDRLVDVMDDTIADAGSVVLACSALKRMYRDRLSAGGAPAPLFIHLSGTRDLIHRRMTARREHFMPVALLDSQIATLEMVGPDENGLTVDIEESTDEIVHRVLTDLGH